MRTIYRQNPGNAPKAEIDQQPFFQKKAARGLELRRKGWTWKRIARSLKIPDLNGNPDPGLTFKIVMEHYQPRLPVTLDRLGAPLTCYTCGRPMRHYRSKYNAVKAELDGFLFASQAEMRRYSELQLLEKAGEIKDLVIHPSWPLKVNGELVCNYEADFQYYDIQKSALIIEDVKGMKTPIYRLKAKLMKAVYDIVIKEVKA